MQIPPITYDDFFLERLPYLLKSSMADLKGDEPSLYVLQVKYCVTVAHFTYPSRIYMERDLLVKSPVWLHL